MKHDGVSPIYGGHGPLIARPARLVRPDGSDLSSAAGIAADLAAATPAVGDHDDPTPRAIEGPYYKPLSPRRFDLREPGRPGKPVELTGTIFTRSHQPVPGAIVDLWHADAVGDYDNAGFRNRGHVITGPDGKYRFTTIKPGGYGSWSDGTGRTVHYHVIVRAAPTVWPFTTQFYFPDEPDNLRDDYFRHDLVLKVKPAGEGLYASFDIVVETFRKL